MDTIVIDIGSYYIKYGYNTHESPFLIRNNICYYPKNNQYQNYEIGYGNSNTKCSHPVENGVVKNWEDLEKVLDRIFYYDLNIQDFSTVNLFNLVAPHESLQTKKRFMKLAFETYGFNSYQSMSKVYSSLLATGRTTGLVVDIGHSITTINPIYEGFVVMEGNMFSGACGNHISKYLKIKLDGELNNNKKLNIETSHFIKDRILEFGDKLKYNNLFLNDELISNEMINPYYYLDYGLIHDIHKSIKSVGIDLRKVMYENIIVTGYGSKSEALIKKIKDGIPQGKIVDVNNREILGWIGGKIITNIPSFKYKWITKEEYAKVGVDSVVLKML